MIYKFFKAAFWYNFITDKKYRSFTILAIIGIIFFGYYSWFYNESNKGDINLKYNVNTSELFGKDVKTYMEKNGFDFSTGNPIYASNMTLINDGVDFRRYKNDDNSIKYQYCNTNVYPICIDIDISIEDLPKYYETNGANYDRVVKIYEDYNLKLSQLKLKSSQIKSALDYYYNELYGE